jgi:hypothetical protein
MAAASANAIFVNINFPLAPNGSSKFTQNRQWPPCPDILKPRLLTGWFPRAAAEGRPAGEGKEMFETK